MVALEVGGVAEGVVPTPVFPGQEATKSINDNYRLRPTVLNKVIYRLDKGLYQRTLQKFWQKWQMLGANPRVVSILRGIHATLQNQTLSDPVTSDQEWLCTSRKELVPQRGIARSNKQVGSRKSGCPVIPGLLQVAVSSPKTQQQMETYFGPQPTKLVFAAGNFQDGNTRNNSAVSSKRGMGDFAGFQRRIFPHSHQPEISKVPRVFPRQGDLPVHCSSFRVGHGSIRVYQSVQGSETHGTSKGYQSTST